MPHSSGPYSYMPIHGCLEKGTRGQWWWWILLASFLYQMCGILNSVQEKVNIRLFKGLCIYIGVFWWLWHAVSYMWVEITRSKIINSALMKKICDTSENKCSRCMISVTVCAQNLNIISYPTLESTLPNLYCIVWLFSVHALTVSGSEMNMMVWLIGVRVTPEMVPGAQPETVAPMGFIWLKSWVGRQ